MIRVSLAALLLALTQTAAAQDTWQQTPRVQESQERGAARTSPDEPDVAVTNDELLGGPQASWIWGADDNVDYFVEVSFEAQDVTAARVIASCDNAGTVFLNGRQVASGGEWSTPMTANVTQHLRNGTNVLSADVRNEGGIAAFVARLAWKDASGDVHHVVTDGNWTIRNKNLSNGERVAVRATYGAKPWGRVFDSLDVSSGRVPRGVFEVLPGYQVEKLFEVPKDQLGSWVCIAFDSQGRLLASDQGGKGICRITPAKAGDANAETRVERLDFSKCEYQPTGAQGILCAFDAVYFCCNGGPGSGLYRARDLDGDDQFDECVRLKQFRGGGEHGPHSLRLSPDGKRIFVIAGNHTDPPFKAGEDLSNENYSSRISTDWGEDLLLPRMWDANGHARGKLAPGGWIASTDPDGVTWDIWSIGYRNPYDMAFNAEGELFAYDADMEWDVGSPWYRPTRVVHATSGSEFGWRSGTGKWPEYYFDSLPPLVNIGPGSPVGVDFGYGLKFPAKYQKALYICDWTFGTMYAIHMDPRQSSYTGTKEEFVSRSPLPLTDCAAGPDGALYFTIGGRGSQSELYRVTYVGTEPTATADYVEQDELAERRRLRRQVEEQHGAPYSDEQFAAQMQTLQGIGLSSLYEDRFLRSALRANLVSASFAKRLKQQLDRGGSPPAITLLAEQILLASRVGSLSSVEWDAAAVRGQLLDAVPSAAWETASKQEKLDLLRALAVCFARLGEPTDSERVALLEQFDERFPADDASVNRELCQLLVYLKSATVVNKTVSLLNAPAQREDIDLGELLTRNAGYGRAIKAMIDNQPDKTQVWLAFCLRVATEGWTPEHRNDYYRWFGRARKWSGGNSFRKFLQNIENEAWEKTPFDHRVLVEAAGARTPYVVPALPKPAGPGRKWTLEEVRQLAASGLKDRDFDNGQKMFAATRCIVCHRYNGDGGATGPDLTQVAGRFNMSALTEAIMEPSKVISDQYMASTVVTAAGKTINGRIVSENEEQISVLTDPEDSTKILDIAREDIDEVLPSRVSIMPAELLNQLNEDEVLDLLAYLLSRGDKRNRMFRR